MGEEKDTPDWIQSSPIVNIKGELQTKFNIIFNYPYSFPKLLCDFFM